MTSEELIETIDELEARMRMLKDTVQRLNDKLHALATPTPTLPDRSGYYLTQERRLLFKNDDGSEGEWVAFGDNGNHRLHFWEPSAFGTFTRDPEVVYEALGPDAFPLVPLSEVILPSEHIKEDEED